MDSFLFPFLPSILLILSLSSTILNKMALCPSAFRLTPPVKMATTSSTIIFKYNHLQGRKTEGTKPGSSPLVLAPSWENKIFSRGYREEFQYLIEKNTSLSHVVTFTERVIICQSSRTFQGRRVNDSIA